MSRFELVATRTAIFSVFEKRQEHLGERNEQDIGRFLELVYNQKRSHSSPAYLPSTGFGADFNPKRKTKQTVAP